MVGRWTVSFNGYAFKNKKKNKMQNVKDTVKNYLWPDHCHISFLTRSMDDVGWRHQLAELAVTEAPERSPSVSGRYRTTFVSTIKLTVPSPMSYKSIFISIINSYNAQTFNCQWEPTEVTSVYTQPAAKTIIFPSVHIGIRLVMNNGFKNTWQTVYTDISLFLL